MSEVPSEAQFAPENATQIKNTELPLKFRTIEESFIEKILPFSSDQELRERYINFFDGLRMGKLLEELDLIAGQVAYKHTEGWERGLTIVTAACDRIDLLGPLRSDQDLQLLASINWVGRSSLEVGVKISSRKEGNWKQVARAYFIMVARQNGEAATVNSLNPKTDEELARFKQGEARQQQRRSLAQTSYLQNTPTEAESKVLHNLFLNIKNELIAGIPMKETTRQSTLLMHPQSRNVHNNIFGGYLMREALELAWNISFLYCRQRPHFISMDHMYFYQPVEIGSILSFTGTVIYTNESALMVEIETEVINPQTGKTQVTNVCYFTFSAMDINGNPQQVPSVLPDSYEEGLKYLEGAKRYEYGQSNRKQLTPSNSH